MIELSDANKNLGDIFNRYEQYGV